MSGTTSRGTYSVDIVRDPLKPLTGTRVKHYVITSTGTSPGVDAKSVSVSAQIQTFASYMHSSNSEETSRGANISFATGDVLDGNVYVNDEINIYGTPQLLGLLGQLQWRRFLRCVRRRAGVERNAVGFRRDVPRSYRRP